MGCIFFFKLESEQMLRCKAMEEEEQALQPRVAAAFPPVVDVTIKLQVSMIFP
jgi:hypothetical protein